MSEIQITSINGMGAITDLGGGSFSTTGMEANDHMHISEDFLVNAGVVSSTDYAVSQAAAPGKKVTVAGGVSYVLNSNYSALSLSEQKYWRCKMGGTTDVNITDNTSGNARIDIICIKVDTTATPDGEATNVASLVVVEGTPAASPTVPATPDDHLKLAEVAVANGFASIVNANITDKRETNSISDNARGWTYANETWAYASATTITVPSGAASKYQKGDKIKIVQTTAKYFYITAVADTVLTVTGGTDYTVANATIETPQYSRASNPLGFPHWFNYTPTYSASASMTFGTVTTTVAKFCVVGNMCTLQVRATGTTGGTASTDLTITPPVNSANAYSSLAGSAIYDGGSPNAAARVMFNNNVALISVGKYDGSNFSLGAARGLAVNGSYQI